MYKSASRIQSQGAGHGVQVSIVQGVFRCYKLVRHILILGFNDWLRVFFRIYKL